VTRREALLIRAFCAWTVYVWATRIWNIIGDDTRSFGFKAVHTVLAVISVAFAVLVWRVVHRVRHRERAEAREE
jgi:membrane protein implicated in regulation of membrane protease activity